MNFKCGGVGGVYSKAVEREQKLNLVCDTLEANISVSAERT